MKLSVKIWAIALVWVAERVWCQMEPTRPTDIWDVEVWGGLPPFDESINTQDGSPDWPLSLSWNEKPVFDPLPRPELSKAARFPNPCTDSNFLSPVYDLSGWDMTKTYLNASGEYPLRYHFNVTVQDIANGYSVRCSGAFPVPWDPNRDWAVLCTPDGGFLDDNYGGNIWLIFFPLQRGEHGHRPDPREIFIAGTPLIAGTPIGVDHIWHCPPSANESLFPRVYRANGGLRDNADRDETPTRFNGSCPLREMTNIPYACNVTTSPALNSTITRQYISEKTRPLVPKPFSVPPEDRPQLPPTQDCTAVSLSYPDWVVEDGATYVPSPPKTDNNSTVFNATITSRATGVTNDCSWKAVGQWLTCRPSPGMLQDRTQTLFQVYFNINSRELTINQNWTCGDTEGNYLRAYRASKTYAMPLYCTKDQGGACRANRHVVKGELQVPFRLTPVSITPPPGAYLTGCTARSASPRWIVSDFRYEETRKTQKVGYGPGSPPTPTSWQAPTRRIRLSLTNEANGYLQSCATISVDVNSTTLLTPWIRCFPDNSVAQRYIETYIRFDTARGALSLDQTWYCADTDPARPLLYQGTASIKATHCGETNITINDICTNAVGCTEYINTRWCDTARRVAGTNGLLEPQNKTFTGQLIRTEALPSNALTDPDPDPDAWNCLADSVGKPVTWTFRPAPWYDTMQPSAFFTTSPIYRYESSFSVYLENSALARRPGSPKWGSEVGARTEYLTPYVGEDWQPTYDYTIGGVWADSRRRPFLNVVDWAFRFDAMKGYLEVNHSWYCDEKSPGKPVLFNGTWMGYVDMDCRWNVTGRAVGCYFQSKELVVRPEVKWTMLSSMNGLPRFL